MIMRKLLFAIIILFCAFGNIFAQVPASKEKSDKMVSELSAATSSFKTITCDFTQQKKLEMLNDVMISEGKMIYKQNNKLRWEYVKPYQYTFVLNDAKVIIKSSQNTTVVDVNNSRVFQEIARIMMNSVTGNCLKDNSDFKVVMYEANGLWMASLTPLKKEMKQMFSKVNIFFDPKQKTVVAIEMHEASGDLTRIDIKNIKLNQPVDEKTFVVN